MSDALMEAAKLLDEHRQEADALWDELILVKEELTQARLREIGLVADADRATKALRAVLRYVPEGTEEYRGAILAIEAHEAGT